MITSLVNASSLQLECGKVLYEGLLVPVLMYGDGTVVRRGKTRSRLGLYR